MGVIYENVGVYIKINEWMYEVYTDGLRDGYIKVVRGMWYLCL